MGRSYVANCQSRDVWLLQLLVQIKLSKHGKPNVQTPASIALKPGILQVPSPKRRAARGGLHSIRRLFLLKVLLPKTGTGRFSQSCCTCWRLRFRRLNMSHTPKLTVARESCPKSKLLSPVCKRPRIPARQSDLRGPQSTPLKLHQAWQS